jgi:crotonobetainyl-CoA:carnitine CoA-transferase CaiB-like acyl-CoA transferase
VSDKSMPLSRFKVIDLTRARAGPTAVRQLADWGADVIRVEMPAAMGMEVMGADRHGYESQNLHRNKRSLTLNLKSGEGKKIFFDLAKGADVVVENYRPHVKHRLGLDYEAVRKVNPRIVYGSISGFGQEGPYSGRPGLDQISQGLSGLMSVTGEPGKGPMRVGIPISDLSAGMMLAQGVLLALLERESSGEGQWVHTSLLEAQIQMMDLQVARYLINGEVPGQAGNNHPTFAPTGVFETSDGLINIQSGPPRLWERLAPAIGAPELLEHPDYIDPERRLENRDALNEEINKRTREKTSEEWISILNESGIPSGPIYTVDQTFADPQVQVLGMSPHVDHPVLGEVKIVGQAVKMSRTPQRMRFATPELGAHTEEILKTLDYSDGDIQKLRDGGVI